MTSERGSVAINVLVILLVLVAGILGYLMLQNHGEPLGRTIGVASPGYDAAPDAYDYASDGFWDGLPRVADDRSDFELDEFGAGTSRIEVFMRDLDGDGVADRITRTRIENGTDHFSDVYKIELARGAGWVDITPPEFYTVEGAECALQKIRFVFRPEFQVIKVSRPWEESWVTPTMAEKTMYAISGGAMRVIQQVPLKNVCDVADLM